MNAAHWSRAGLATPNHDRVHVSAERRASSAIRLCGLLHSTRQPSDSQAQLISANLSAVTGLTRRQVALQAALLPVWSTWLYRSRPAAAYAGQPALSAERAGDSVVTTDKRTAQHQGSGVPASDYDRYAAGYDQLDTGVAAEAFGIPALRRSLISAAYGDVLEVAIGTGINLPLYNRQQVQTLVGVDLSQGMLQQAASKSSSCKGLKLSLQQGDVNALPFDDTTFDCVVDTFSLCVFPNSLLALQQMARVLRPDGVLLLLEHSRSHLPGLGLYQDVTAPAVAALGKGCKWNQDVAGLLGKAGLKPVKVQQALGGLITSIEARKL